jgi:hypothetical protein
VTDHLLASIYDALSVANWQRSADGSKGKNKPKPLKRPGEEAAREEKQAVLKEKSVSLPVAASEWERHMAARRKRQEEASAREELKRQEAALRESAA